MKWHFDMASEIGGRPEQQDRAEVFAIPNRPNDCLVVLADGMGGQQDGGLAAQAVLDCAEQLLSLATIGNPRHFLTDLCDRAHRAIRHIGRKRRSDPASTCVFLYVSDEEAYWAHVGDSRLYHFDAGNLLSHTRDHTVGELLRDNASADPTDSGVDNRLYMCLGGQNQLQPEFGATATGSGDWFLLCSDGFWNQVGADEVAAHLSAVRPGKEVAAELVNLATERGGSSGDNASLVLVRRRTSRLATAWRRVLG